MITTLILSALKNKFLTILIFLGIVVLGTVVLYRTPIDALPDLSENQVIVMTEWMGQSPKNVEDQVTHPLTVALQSLPGVKAVRAGSQMGLSMVTVIFSDTVDYYFARDRVSEKLRQVTTDLPPGVTPVLGPDATGLGQIFMYTVDSPDMSLTDLRTVQDYTVRSALQSVPGVAEIASVGGYVKTYEVLVDPIKLAQQNIGLMDITSKIQAANGNVSGRVIAQGDSEIAVQGYGFFTSPASISSLVIGQRSEGIPLTIADIGTVRQSGAYRRDVLADDQTEKVGGIVVMRFGENPLTVIQGIKDRLREIAHSLPTGVTITPYYDRTRLINGAIHTMSRVIIEEMVVTAIILAFFLFHFGATLITNIALIVGVVLTFIFMYFAGIPSNIMSLGGIAISIGTMVDAGIVMTENMYRKLLMHTPKTTAERIALIGDGALEVGRPIMFAILITIVSFVPILSLQGIEGKLFSPLAYTHLFGLFGALITSLLLLPLLGFFFLRGRLHDDQDLPLVRWLQRRYEPILRSALTHRVRQILLVSIFASITYFLAFGIGSEFMPPLQEGTLMYMPVTAPDISEQHAQELLLATNKIIAGFPEVERVVGKAGRADTATDPSPLSMFETIITLKDKAAWPSGYTQDHIVKDMNDAITISGLWNGFTQPIIGRIDMLSTGVRSDVGVKIFGDDPTRLEQLAIQAEDILGAVPGAADVVAVRNSGLQYLNIHLNDDALARYTVQKSDVLMLIATGVGGEIATNTIDGRKRIGIEVRLNETSRQTARDVRALLVPTQHGTRIPLWRVADITQDDGPAMIQSEGGMITSVVQMGIEGRDMGSFVQDAQATLAAKLQLPTGYYTQWTGHYENKLHAEATLRFVLPLVLVIIFALLFIAYHDLGLVMIVMLTIPLSVSGGLLGLLIAGFHFSVSVWVGFVTLFGTAVSMSVVKVVYLENAYRARCGIPLYAGEEHIGPKITGAPKVITKYDITEAIVAGATLRLRPILMTTLVTIIGLIPMLTSEGTGAEVTKPLAVVLIGGLISTALMTLTLVPVLFAYLRERQVGQHGEDLT